MKLKIRIPFILMIVLFHFGSTHARAETPNVAAWIETVAPKDALTLVNGEAKVVVLRQGKPLASTALAAMTVLESGDRILINDSHAYLNLITSTGRLRVTKDMAKVNGYEINASESSIWRNLVALMIDKIIDKIKLGQAQAVSAYTRGRGGPLNIPSGHKLAPKVATGARDLHVLWEGGDPPYRLSLLQNDQVIIERAVPDGHEAALTMRSLLPGKYQLVLKDKNAVLLGDAWVEDLILVSPGDVPPMPLALANALLPEEVRHLLYAEWLARQGTGEWRMEAIQQVFPYAGNYEPAANWMKQWGEE